MNDKKNSRGVWNNSTLHIKFSICHRFNLIALSFFFRLLVVSFDAFYGKRHWCQILACGYSAIWFVFITWYEFSCIVPRVMGLPMRQKEKKSICLTFIICVVRIKRFSMTRKEKKKVPLRSSLWSQWKSCQTTKLPQHTNLLRILQTTEAFMFDERNWSKKNDNKQIKHTEPLKTKPIRASVKNVYRLAGYE